jgi:hypothetical protein
MLTRVVGHSLLIVATSTAVSFAPHIVGRGSAEAPAPMQLAIHVQLVPGETLSTAAAGDLTGGFEPALVLGTQLPGPHSRVRVMHRQGDRYETVWTFTSDAEGIDSLIIRHLHNNAPNDLLTLWRSGSGGYLDMLIFEWNGRTYREIWNLDQFVKGGQLIQRAKLATRQFDSYGNVELVIRAPNIHPGDTTRGPLPHQVSIYRWDARKQTFVLFTRYVDPNKTFE